MHAFFSTPTSVMRQRFRKNPQFLSTLVSLFTDLKQNIISLGLRCGLEDSSGGIPSPESTAKVSGDGFLSEEIRPGTLLVQEAYLFETCTRYIMHTSNIFLNKLFPLNFLFNIEVQQINNVVIVSSGQQRDPAIVCMYPFSLKLPSHPGCHITLRRVPCAIQGPC